MESHSVCENSDDDDSEGNLKIVTESPKSRKNRSRQVELNPEEKQVIETIGKHLEEAIEIKAAKSNLSTVNVKTILKHVVSNEHVIALMRKVENPDQDTTDFFQPKLTRAKAKELFSSSNASLPWLTPTRPTSEVHKLITEELDEDSSGDEYVPGEEESEDDRDSSVLSESDVRSISPPTPLQLPGSPQEVNWTEDGVFKIPPAKLKEDNAVEEANIALRTRSKLSLSATPLEVIEEAFIPPDITTDMYDMHCDDEVWSDFLKTFTKPLDEVVKPTEDEEHDPEYNILADENMNESDTEELRADKAVKVSKKELNELIAELFDAADFGSDQDDNDMNNSTLTTTGTSEFDVLLQNPASFDTTAGNDFPRIQPSCPTVYNFMMQVDQKMLLEQQMHQHVQMLTQNFLLTYRYPEFHGVALKAREFLLNLTLLAGSKKESAFRAVNLEGALKLVEFWENQFALSTDAIKEMKEYVCRVQHEARQCWAAGTEYIHTFPPLILETISNSDVFIYPSLLPRIPFKSVKTYNPCSSFSQYEDELLAIGLEQFIPYLAEDQKNFTVKGEVKLKLASSLIVNYLMPPVTINRAYGRILNLKNGRSGSNPVKYYFEHQKAPVTMHYVVDLPDFGVVPPRKRTKEVLPIQWRNYIYPETIRAQPEIPTVAANNLTKVTKPPFFNKYVKKCSYVKSYKSIFTPIRKHLKPNRNKHNLIYCSTPKAKSIVHTKKLETYFQSPKVVGYKKKDCVDCLKFNSSIFRKLREPNNMLPSMPVLGNSNNSNDSNSIKNVEDNIQGLADSTTNSNEIIEADSTCIVIAEEDEVVEKDNEEEISALMVASSTINNTNSSKVKQDEVIEKDTEEAVSAVIVASPAKNTTTGRKSLSGAEKKKAKLCREYNATLAMLKPEDPNVVQERAQSYAQAYFEKARECLNPQEYERFMEILNNFNDGTNKVADLYNQMEVLLAAKHQDLLEEFLTFLTSSQAKDIGKLILYYKLGNMSLFLHKLEIYFKDQPAHIRKIYRSLTDLCTCVDVTMDRVKNTILPLLKGNTLLVDWFLQIFPNEPPPKSLLNGQWEQLDIKTDFIPNKDQFETVTVPDDDVIYGGPNCSCTCHQQENPVFKTRLQHCLPCGLKFVQGRVYVPTEKGLRLAHVTFPGSTDVDHNLRIYCPTNKRGKRCETSPSKQLTSPTKEAPEEIRLTCDSEDDGDTPKKRSRASRSPRKKKVKANLKPEKTKRRQPEIIERTTNNAPDEPDTRPSISTANRVTFQEEECGAKEKFKQSTDEITEWDCNTSIESIELKHSPEHSAGSESEFCEESSQDNINTETDDTAEELESGCNSPVHSENSNSNTEPMWTREEDKIILETFQKKGDKEEAFISIANELAYRTIADIQDRFNTLMTILQKLISSENSTL